MVRVQPGEQRETAGDLRKRKAAAVSLLRCRVYASFATHDCPCNEPRAGDEVETSVEGEQLRELLHLVLDDRRFGSEADMAMAAITARLELHVVPATCLSPTAARSRYARNETKVGIAPSQHGRRRLRRYGIRSRNGLDQNVERRRSRLTVKRGGKDAADLGDSCCRAQFGLRSSRRAEGTR